MVYIIILVFPKFSNLVLSAAGWIKPRHWQLLLRAVDQHHFHWAWWDQLPSDIEDEIHHQFLKCHSFHCNYLLLNKPLRWGLVKWICEPMNVWFPGMDDKKRTSTFLLLRESWRLSVNIHNGANNSSVFVCMCACDWSAREEMSHCYLFDISVTTGIWTPASLWQMPRLSQARL